jgi:hypothetical protein
MSKSQDMMREPILQRGTDKMIPRYAFHKPSTVRLPDRSEWDRGSIPLGRKGLIWYMNGSKINEGTGAGVYGHGMRQRYSFNLGRYVMVFQAKVYAIKPCTNQNIKRGYHNRNIYILSDSQGAINPSRSPLITTPALCWSI